MAAFRMRTRLEQFEFLLCSCSPPFEIICPLKPTMTPEEREDRREFRKIFAETGHRTLNAFLIVSTGAALAFLTFIGTVFKEDLIGKIPADVIHAFAKTIQSFPVSIASCMLMFTLSYLSHGAYHLRRDRLGLRLSIITIFCGCVCLSAFIFGSYKAIRALDLAATALAKKSP